MAPSRAVIIGLGGIGSNLFDLLCRTLRFSKSERKFNRIIAIDGDMYEEKNRERQSFALPGNKAHSKCGSLSGQYPELSIDAKPHYIDAKNVYLFIKEGDVVFLCVDNHATRKIVNEYAKTLRDVLVISGGNEEYDGNVQIYERRDGKDVKPSLTYLHPEIENPTDKNPADLPCGVLAEAGSTQLFSVNDTIAAMMHNAFTLFLQFGDIPYTEQFFDMKTGNMRAVKRIVE